MSVVPVIAVFDVGKTNKKVMLLDEDYVIQWEHSVKFDEVADEDGFPCEDVHALTSWVKDTFNRLIAMPEFEIRATNFSAYGASFVHINKDDEAFLPLYNYLKPYPPDLQKQFYDTYGGESKVAIETASPILGHLNSGMLLYRLKHEQPEKFRSIKYSLHLPQYLSFILSGKTRSEITSIGCHTNLWNFQIGYYHDWIYKENINQVLAPIGDGDCLVCIKDNVQIGLGLHDSSAALIPYLVNFTDPFILISTGTWCISLNPFNKVPLTEEELKNDCLLFMKYTGGNVKASRLFAGYEHEQQIKRLAEHFNKPEDHYASVKYNSEILPSLKKDSAATHQQGMHVSISASSFEDRGLSSFENYEQAYHQLIADIIVQQINSTQLVLNGTDVNRIFVDGGFSKNPVYMSLLANEFLDYEVYAASVPQASAIGAALAIHQYWNNKAFPQDIIELKKYSSK
jgi:sugar (pentulose or hexulose) kinase